MCDCHAHQYPGRECTCNCDHTIPKLTHLFLTTEHESRDNNPDYARKIVEQWAVHSLQVPEGTGFYVVWFCFILGGWKALVSSTEADGRYYEVTFNKMTEEVYVDTYRKTHNVSLTIESVKEL